jgi:hypothetical protein
MNTKAIIAAGLAGVLFLGVTIPSYAQSGSPPAKSNAAPKLPGTEEAPGFEDFEKGDLSQKDVQELEERRDDRNSVSPGSQDEQELDQEMDADGN